MTQPLNDFSLITRLQQGHLEALGQLFDLYRLSVFRTSLAITRDPHTAEDILQETFLRLNTYAHRLDPNRPVLPWLYRVAINLSRTYVTRRARWFITPFDDFLERLVSPFSQRPEPLAEQNEETNAVYAALQTLKFDQRVAIVLFYVNELSVEEIADVLDCPIGTIKSRLYYGRQNLKKCLLNETDLFSALGWV